MGEKLKKADTEHLSDALKDAKERYYGESYRGVQGYQGLDPRQVEQDEKLLVYEQEALLRNGSRSRRDKIFGHRLLTAVDIAHEKAIAENEVEPFVA